MTNDTASRSAIPAQTWTIVPGSPGPLATITEIWRSRRLLPLIAVRSLRKIYRRTVLGWIWLVILPLFPIALRTIVFGGLLNVASDGVPYILFLAAGSLIWDLFAQGLTWGTRALEISGSVAEQTYVPRAIIPVGGMAPAVVDFFCKLGAFVLIAGALWAVRGRLDVSVHAVGWAIAALAVAWTLALGLSFFTSRWSEQGRDTRILLGQILAVWYLLTPVLYPVSAMPENWRRWMLLNPMAPPVETFKWAVLGVGRHDADAFLRATGLTAIVLVLGLLYFARMEAAADDER
jgi:lipopolysaccharide transport system permease protein